LPSTPAEAILVVLVTTVLFGAVSSAGFDPEQPLSASAVATAAASPGHTARESTTRR
jgi:hypothetical protein